LLNCRWVRFEGIICKNVLRARRGRTHADVAHGLRLSESSTKRRFAKKNLDRIRLEQICGQMGQEIVDRILEGLGLRK